MTIMMTSHSKRILQHRLFACSQWFRNRMVYNSITSNPTHGQNTLPKIHLSIIVWPFAYLLLHHFIIITVFCSNINIDSNASLWSWRYYSLLREERIIICFGTITLTHHCSFLPHRSFICCTLKYTVKVVSDQPLFCYRLYPANIQCYAVSRRSKKKHWSTFRSINSSIKLSTYQNNSFDALTYFGAKLKLLFRKKHMSKLVSQIKQPHINDGTPTNHNFIRGLNYDLINVLPKIFEAHSDVVVDIWIFLGKEVHSMVWAQPKKLALINWLKIGCY